MCFSGPKPPISVNIGNQINVLQLNIEGISAAKRDIVAKLAVTHKCDIILLQETHTTSDNQLAIAGYDTVSHQHHRQYGLATYARSDIHVDVLPTTGTSDQTQYQALLVEGVTIYNIYKPPSTSWPNPPLPTCANPVLYCGDFNSHHPDWGYARSDSDGDVISEWASNSNLTCLYDPKQPKTFHSARWNTDTNPDLVFVSDDSSDAKLSVLDRFPHSQHRPTLIQYGTSIKSTNSSPKLRWNFRKAQWQDFTDHIETCIDKLPLAHENIDAEYKDFCEIIVNAAKNTIPRGCRKQYIPCWSEETTDIYNQFLDANTPTESKKYATQLIENLNQERQRRWESTVNDIDFTHSSRRAWKTVHQLTADPCLKKKKETKVCANAIAAKLLENGRCSNTDKKSTRDTKRSVTDMWQSHSADSNLSEPFTQTEIESAISMLKTNKAPGPDYIHNEFIIHLGPAAVTWLLSFLNFCHSQLRIPRIWRRSNVIALLKPGKPDDDAKSYRPISLLCAIYKLLERLILMRIEPILETQLPHEQAGFRKKRSTQDQVIRLTQDIETAYENNEKSGAVFVDLTAAYDTVWHAGLTLKLLRMIPCKHMVRLIMEMITNRSFVLTAGETKSRLRRLRNGLPRGSVLAPSLFNVYTADLPTTVSTKYVYADDICLLYSAKNFGNINETLTKDMNIL